MCGSSARGRGGMKPTAIRCSRCAVRSIMGHWSRCLYGTNSGYGKRQNDRMLPLETAFKHIEAYFHSEINTLGYPKAALFGFCLALVAYNVLAVVLAALRGVHGQEKIDQEVSLYYVANEIATTSTGMMIAIPESEWGVFSTMRTPELAETLMALAQHVHLDAFRKSPTRA